MSANHSNLIRAATYYRKSTNRQEDSIERQRAQAVPYAAKQGYQFTSETYVDEGISGDEFDKRPGFQRLLRDAQAGKFEVIVVDEPSRLSRQNPIDLIEKVIAPLRRARIKIDTVSKGPLDYGSLAGIIMMTVHAHKAEDESRDLGRRILGGIAEKVKDGLWFGWSPPYGLRMERTIDPQTGKVLARRCVFGPKEEVRAVRFIFDAVANRWWPLRRVCRELEARGVRPPTTGKGSNKAEGRWNPSTVRKFLVNRKYVGDLTWNETHKGKYYAWKGGAGGRTQEHQGTVNRSCSRNAQEDVIVIPIPDLIPPLIDRDTFSRAAAALERSQKRTSPRTGDHLFTHMLVCGDCGSFMRGQPDHGQKGYICAKYKEYGSKACNRNTVKEAALMKSILKSVKDDILNPRRLDQIEEEIKRRLKADSDSGEDDRLRQRVSALDRDIAQGHANHARLPEDRLPGVIAQVRQWEKERGDLQARLRELEGGTSESQAVLAEARRQLWRLRESLENGDEEAQACVIREIVSKVEVTFTHERTHGRRSATGRNRLYNRPSGAILYVRPGLGLSCLCIPDSPRRAHAGA
jgi:DNA invertase Pin-like site-specific DNA recombinase